VIEAPETTNCGGMTHFLAARCCIQATFRPASSLDAFLCCCPTRGHWLKRLATNWLVGGGLSSPVPLDSSCSSHPASIPQDAEASHTGKLKYLQRSHAFSLLRDGREFLLYRVSAIDLYLCLAPCLSP
jgi:hypothetical protein